MTTGEEEVGLGGLGQADTAFLDAAITMVMALLSVRKSGMRAANSVHPSRSLLDVQASTRHGRPVI